MAVDRKSYAVVPEAGCHRRHHIHSHWLLTPLLVTAVGQPARFRDILPVIRPRYTFFLRYKSKRSKGLLITTSNSTIILHIPALFICVSLYNQPSLSVPSLPLGPSFLVSGVLELSSPCSDWAISLFWFSDLPESLIYGSLLSDLPELCAPSAICRSCVSLCWC